MTAKLPQASDWALFYKLFANLLAAGHSPVESLTQLAQEPILAGRTRRLRAQLAKLPAAAPLADCLKLPVLALDAATLGLFEKAARVEDQTALLDALAARYSQAHWVEQLRSLSPYWLGAYFVFISMIVFNVLYFVVPGFADFYAQMDADLEPRLAILLALREWIVALVVCMAIMFIAIQAQWVSRASVDRVKLIAPWGVAVRKIALARFTRMLALLLAKKMPPRDAIVMAIGATGNTVIERQLQNAVAAIPALSQPVDFPFSIADALKSVALIPAAFTAALGIAERTRKLDETLPEIAAASADSIVRYSHMLRNVIDTVAVVVLGGFVGYIVMVVYLPVFRLGQII